MSCSKATEECSWCSGRHNDRVLWILPLRWRICTSFVLSSASRLAPFFFLWHRNLRCDRPECAVPLDCWPAAVRTLGVSFMRCAITIHSNSGCADAFVDGLLSRIGLLRGRDFLTSSACADRGTAFCGSQLFWLLHVGFCWEVFLCQLTRKCLFHDCFGLTESPSSWLIELNSSNLLLAAC